MIPPLSRETAREVLDEFLPTMYADPEHMPEDVKENITDIMHAMIAGCRQSAHSEDFWHAIHALTFAMDDRRGNALSALGVTP